MMTPSELPGYIRSAVPGLSIANSSRGQKNVYDAVRLLFAHTEDMVERHNYSIAKQCMEAAEQIYIQGNLLLKNAIENVYVFSFSHGFFCDRNNRKELMAIMPSVLYGIYKQQMLDSHL